MDGRTFVCLSDPLSRLKSWITFGKMKERILMKILGPVLHCTSNFWVGITDQLASKLWPWAKNCLFLQNPSPPWVYVLQVHDIPQAWSWILIFGVEPEILVYVWVGTQGNFYFRIQYFLHKIDPPTIKIWEHFMLCHFLIWGHPRGLGDPQNSSK
jgi:hypothetical protein